MSLVRLTPRVAVIGAGPSGFFAVDALLKQLPEVSVDLFDRLPTPYGLVRYGVAPDHPKIKQVTALYAKVCQDPRVRFFGNVPFGQALLRSDVKRHYDAVIYAVGASSDRPLGVPGESLEGSLSATEFVAWYNGHPDYADLDVDLSVERVAVVGVGNVAVDVARILAKDPDELYPTDITDAALGRLRESRIEEIYLLGRRGPAQAKFTTKELRELGELANADFVIDPGELELDPESEASIAHDPVAQKNIEVMREYAARAPTGKPRRLYLRFYRAPVEILGETHVEAIKLERTRLELTESGYLNAVGTGEFETLPVGMVLRSIGYRGVPLEGVPFDARRGVIPNLAGRMLSSPGGEVVPGEYVCGWIKRGPVGVIGTNKADALETVKALLEDLPRLPPLAPEDADARAIPALLEARGVAYVSFEDYLRLDAFELAEGRARGRARVKLTSLQAMLERCHSEG